MTTNPRYVSPEIRTIQSNDILERLGPSAGGSFNPVDTIGTTGSGLSTHGTRGQSAP